MEYQCYGCTQADLDEMMEHKFARTLSMLAMSILSDAQQELNSATLNVSRQFMNRAKYVLSKTMEIEHAHVELQARHKRTNEALTGLRTTLATALDTSLDTK